MIYNVHLSLKIFLGKVKINNQSIKMLGIEILTFEGRGSENVKLQISKKLLKPVR